MAASTVGTLIVELRAGTAAFASDVGKIKQLSFNTAKEMERSFKVMGTALVGALTAAAGAATALAIRSIDTADKMGKMAQSAGVTVEQFSSLAFAAKLADVDAQQLSVAFTQLSRSIDRTNRSGTESQAAISGLSELFGGAVPVFKNADEAFTLIAERISKLPDGLQKTAIATQIFGRAGAQLIPLLNAGAAGLEEFKKEAAALGLVITEKAAKGAEAFNDTLTRLKGALDGLGNRLAEALLPHLQNAAEWLTAAATNASGLERNLTILTTAVKISATSVLGLWSALTDVANAIALTTVALGPGFKSWEEYKAAVKSSIEEFKKGSGAAELIRDIWNPALAGLVQYGPPVATAITKIGEEADKLAPKLERVSGITEGFRMRLWELSKLKASFPEVAAPEIPQTLQEMDLGSIGGGQGVAFPQAELLSDNLGMIRDRFKELRPLAQELQSSLGDLFEQAIFHADSFVDALGRIAQAIAAMALRMLVIQPLLNSLGGLFGATGSLPLTPGRGGISLAGFGGLAAGGPIFGPSIVGEKGPEVFVPNTPGTIVPNDKLFEAIRSGGGSQQAVNHFHFDNVTDFDSFKRSKGQMGAWFQRQLAIAHGRNG